MYRIGLSGTPIYNRGSEIWPIIDILKPGLLGSFKEFCEYFCYVNDKGKAIVLENKRASLRNELQKHVMLRRKKSDVLKELKDKVRYKEVIAADTDFYHDELDKIWKKLEGEQKVAETEFSKAASYHRAIQSERQIAYYLIGNGTLDDHVANILVDKSYEIDAIMDDTVDNYENKDKAKLILAQIQDKIRSK